MDQDSLVAELTELRADVKRLRWQAYLYAFVFASLSFSLGRYLEPARFPPVSVRPQQETIRAQRFEVVDKNGRQCAFITSVNGGAQLMLMKNPMTPGLILDVQGDQPSVRLESENGFALLSIPKMDEKDEKKDLLGPSLILEDKSKVSVAMGATAHSPFLRFHEADGTWTYAQRGDLNRK